MDVGFASPTSKEVGHPDNNVNGRGRIRTCEGIANGFTARPLWPLGYTPPNRPKYAGAHPEHRAEATWFYNISHTMTTKDRETPPGPPGLRPVL